MELDKPILEFTWGNVHNIIKIFLQKDNEEGEFRWTESKGAFVLEYSCF
jgi:hypothetical protein